MVSRRHLWIGLCVLFAAAAAKAAWHLWHVIALEAQGAIDSDALLYFTVGRGILNGLTPWTDLFESKPPGMFLIAALSLLVTGNELLALALQIAIYLLLPTGLAWYVWHASYGKMQIERIGLALIGGLLGVLLSLYLQDRAGGIQGESFATAFALIYFLMALHWKERLNARRMAILSLPLLCAIGVKEPFLVTLLAGALLLTSSPRHFCRSFLVPLCIAGLAGVLLLFLTGWLQPYLSTYVSSMLHGRVDASPVEPLWIRGFSAGRVYGNLTTYYTAPFLGYMLALLWTLIPLFRSKHRASAADSGCTIVTSVVTYKTMITVFPFLVTWQAQRLGLILEQSILPMSGGAFVLLLVALFALHGVQWKRGLLPGHLIALAALYLTALAVGVSIYAVNHFAFAVPALIALVLLFLGYAASEKSSALVAIPVFAFVCLAAFLHQPGEKHLADMRDRLQYASGVNRGTVRQVDALLESCGVERYGSLDAFMALGFARHSPVGPLFVGHFFDYLGREHPLFSETRENVLKAPIVISAGGEDSDRAKEILVSNFTESPPVCAKEHLPIDGLRVFFKK